MAKNRFIQAVKNLVKAEPNPPDSAVPARALPEKSQAEKCAIYAQARRLRSLSADEGAQLVALLTKAGLKHFSRDIGYGIHFRCENFEVVSEKP